MPRIRLHVGFALKEVETRQACAAYEYLMAAILTANKLPKPVLLALGDHIREHAKGRKGGQWDLMRDSDPEELRIELMVAALNAVAAINGCTKEKFMEMAKDAAEEYLDEDDA